MINGKWAENLTQLWGEGAVRVFISHKAECKEVATQLKTCLSSYGIASFVAHEDIKPMQEWQGEMEYALFSMNVLVALLTCEFSESDWTDQEIGVAVGREIPIIPIRMGKDPYGFMGKYQAIKGSTSSAQIAADIFECILRHDESKLLAIDAFIMAVAQSASYHEANSLAKHLSDIEELSSEQIKSLVHAFNNNSQVHKSYGFTNDIVGHLERLTGRNYEITDGWLNESLPW